MSSHPTKLRPNCPHSLDAATREEQATACLEAAALHREPLLALARKLAGSAEEGMELYQQTLLNCHDAIQRNGFAGDRYHFYLAQSIRHLHAQQQRQHRRTVRVDFQHVEAGSSSRDDEGPAPWVANAHRAQGELSALAATPADAYAHLAEQVMQEAKEVFTYNDRVVLRLHAEGLNARQIAELLGGGERTWMHRRLEKLKQHLRATFAQAWQALSEPDDFSF